MTYIEFLTNEISKTNEELKRLDEEVRKFPTRNDFDYTSYGTREEILNQYKTESKKKIRFFSRIKESDLADFVYRRELCRLENIRFQMNAKLQQLKKALECFDGEKITRAIVPNNYVVQSILDYKVLVGLDASELLNMLISLFEKVDASEKRFDAVIERNVAESYNHVLKMFDNVSLNSLLFMLDKVFKMQCSDVFLDKHEETIGEIKSEISLQFNIKEFDRKREKLEKKKRAVDELKKYIDESGVKKIAPSLEYFKILLDNAEISDEQQGKYLADMKKLIDVEEQKEAKRLREKYFEISEMDIWNEALEFLESSSNEQINKFLSRILKDIISICKYMENIVIPEEIQHSYETISEKLQVVKTIISKSCTNEGENSAFYYLSDDNNVPYILKNVATLDSLRYGDVLRMLIRLANGESGIVLNCFNDISLECLGGETTKVFYARKDGNTVIVKVVSENLCGENSINLPRKLWDELSIVFDGAQDEEVKKMHGVFEAVLLQTLDLNCLGDDEKKCSLKKRL